MKCPYCGKGRLIYEKLDGTERVRCSYCGAIFEENPDLCFIESFWSSPEDSRLINPASADYKRKIEGRPEVKKRLDDILGILSREGFETFSDEFRKFFLEIYVELERKNLIKKYNPGIGLAILHFFSKEKGINIPIKKYLLPEYKESYKKFIRYIKRIKGKIPPKDLCTRVYTEFQRRGENIPAGFIKNSIYMLEKLGKISKYDPTNKIAAIIASLYFWVDKRGWKGRKRRDGYSFREISDKYNFTSVSLREYMREIFKGVIGKEPKRIEEEHVDYLREIINAGKEAIDKALEIGSKLSKREITYEEAFKIHKERFKRSSHNASENH